MSMPNKPSRGPVTVPVPDDANPDVSAVYVNVVVLGTLAITHVPLYPVTVTPETVTGMPAVNPCAAVVVIVTVDPDCVAPPDVATVEESVALIPMNIFSFASDTKSAT